MRDAPPARLRFAHLTDIHLPIPEAPSLLDLLGKRALGYLSWTAKRRHLHKSEVSDALAADIRAQGCEAALLTGDLVNIALEREFEAASAWLARAFDGLQLTFCPGNHDAYVRVPWAKSLGLLSRHMSGLRRGESDARAPSNTKDFPFTVDFGPARVVVANSAPPTAPGLATGALGSEQIARIEAELGAARGGGLFSILMLHHPIADVVSRRKALDDRAALAAALQRCGVDLVLHGHAHVAHFEQVATADGPAPAIGGGSFSYIEKHGEATPGRYNLFELERGADRWRLALEVRQYDPATGGVVSVDRRAYERPLRAAANA